MVELSNELPVELPRFCESFRVFIDHPTSRDTRMLTSEWISDWLFGRVLSDFCPLLARAGRLGFICSTIPAGWHGKEVEYYGMDDPPSIYWHWSGGRWVAQAGQELIVAYCAQRKVPVDLFHVPRSQEWGR